MKNDVKIRVAGREWGGWTGVSISAGIERLARDFSIQITRSWPGTEEAWSLQPKVKPGDAVEVFIDDELVITGYVDATPIRYDARTVSVGVMGRSKTADLVDCSAEVEQFTDRTFIQIATELTSPFGLKVVNGGIPDTPIFGLQADYGEPVVDVLDKMMGLQQVLAYDNAHGDLVVGVIGAARCVTALALGENILSCDSERSVKSRYSEYLVAGQRAGDDDDFGEVATSSIESKTTDTGVKRHRPLILKQTGNATGESVIDLGLFEKVRRAAKTDEVTYTVHGWRQGDGSLWQPNKIVTVFDPVLGYNNRQMVIAEVTFSQSENGTLTELRVGPPDAYLPKQHKKKKQAEDEDF